MILLPKLLSEKINLILFWFVLSWTIAISSSLIWNIAANLYTAVDITLIHTKKSFEKNLLLHRWNASYGRVYVPIIEKNAPRTYFYSISEIDFITLSGRKLPMINPGTGLDLSIVHTIIKELNTATIQNG